MAKEIGVLVEMPQSHPLYFESQYRSERRAAIVETYLLKIHNLVSLNRYKEAIDQTAAMTERLVEWDKA